MEEHKFLTASEIFEQATLVIDQIAKENKGYDRLTIEELAMKLVVQKNKTEYWKSLSMKRCSNGN